MYRLVYQEFMKLNQPVPRVPIYSNPLGSD